MKTGWKKLPFEEVIADVSGGNVKTPQGEFLSEGQFAIVDQGKELISGYANEEKRLCKVDIPAIIFGDHTRCFKYVDFPFCMGADGVKVLRPKIDAEIKYLFYYLRQLHITDAGYSRHFKYLKQSEVVIPPLDEQKRIVEILDRVEALRAKRRAALAQLDELTQSIFIDIFGDPTVNPKEWQRSVLGDVIFSASDGPHVSPAYTEDGIPFLSTRHVRAGEIIWEDLKFISQEDAEIHWRKCKPERGDILYTKGGTTGLAATIKTERSFAIWVHVALLKPNQEKVDPVWLEAMLNCGFCYQQSQVLTHGIANRDLGLTRMVKIKIYLPPLSLQKEFVSRIATLEKLKTTNKASLAELDELFASLQYRAFRGEL